jgi:hypothetical protein
MKAWMFLRAFLISWLILVIIFLVLGRAALAFKVPSRIQSLPTWLRGAGAIAALYGWTIPAAILVAAAWYFVRR